MFNVCEIVITTRVFIWGNYFNIIPRQVNCIPKSLMRRNEKAVLDLTFVKMVINPQQKIIPQLPKRYVLTTATSKVYCGCLHNSFYVQFELLVMFG